jgi:hypothetical protein
MKFIAKASWRIAFALSVAVGTLGATPTVSCKNPPGPSGTVICEDGQTPLCEADGKSFRAFCVRTGTSRSEILRILGISGVNLGLIDSGNPNEIRYQNKVITIG